MIIRVWRARESAQGAHKFARLLQTNLSKKHTLVGWDDEARADISLVRGSLSSSQASRIRERKEKLVVQYGGMSDSPESIRAFVNTIKMADGVVFNSNYGKELVHKTACKPTCMETVIHNGSLMSYRASLRDPIFIVACANYSIGIKFQALKASIAAMPEIRREYPEAQLWVAGKAPVMEGIDRYLCHIGDHERLQEERAKASIMLHLVERDNCPNTVVEALGQGIPVICHRNSGTPEVVRYFGASVSDMGPAVVAGKVASLMRLAPMWQERWLSEFQKELHIDVVAGKYERFLERILDGTPVDIHPSGPGN